MRGFPLSLIISLSACAALDTPAGDGPSFRDAATDEGGIGSRDAGPDGDEPSSRDEGLKPAPTTATDAFAPEPASTCPAGAPADVCGVCGGDGTGCLDCAGEPYGDAVVDACGVCGGDGSTCADCEGTPYGPKVLDVCGVCGGSGIPAGTCDCSGRLPGAFYADRDGDGLGEPTRLVQACEAPPGHVENSDDPLPGCASNKLDSCGVCSDGGATGDGDGEGACDGVDSAD